MRPGRGTGTDGCWGRAPVATRGGGRRTRPAGTTRLRWRPAARVPGPGSACGPRRPSWARRPRRGCGMCPEGLSGTPPLGGRRRGRYGQVRPHDPYCRRGQAGCGRQVAKVPGGRAQRVDEVVADPPRVEPLVRLEQLDPGLEQPGPDPAPGGQQGGERPAPGLRTQLHRSDDRSPVLGHHPDRRQDPRRLRGYRRRLTIHFGQSRAVDRRPHPLTHATPPTRAGLLNRNRRSTHTPTTPPRSRAAPLPHMTTPLEAARRCEATPAAHWLADPTGQGKEPGWRCGRVRRWPPGHDRHGLAVVICDRD
jgi:hypothetical protein